MFWHLVENSRRNCRRTWKVRRIRGKEKAGNSVLGWSITKFGTVYLGQNYCLEGKCKGLIPIHYLILDTGFVVFCYNPLTTGIENDMIADMSLTVIIKEIFRLQRGWNKQHQLRICLFYGIKYKWNLVRRLFFAPTPLPNQFRHLV